MRAPTNPHFNDSRVRNATHFARQRVAHAVKFLEDVRNDPKRAERLADHLCPVCTYGGAGIAGQAFTAWKCDACGAVEQHHNTSVPRVCATCAAEYEICRRCLSDLHLLPREGLDPRAAPPPPPKRLPKSVRKRGRP